MPVAAVSTHNRSKPRGARDALGGFCYLVLNRGNGRRTVFRKDANITALMEVLRAAGQRVEVRRLAYRLLPNHVYFALWPRHDGDLGAYRMWLMTASVRRYHQLDHSNGHLWQGRFRSLPIQADDHLLTVQRYVERHPVRAGRVERTQDWTWSSAAPVRANAAEETPPALDPRPVPRPTQWLNYVNEPQTEAEVERLRACLGRRRPYGEEGWTCARKPNFAALWVGQPDVSLFRGVRRIGREDRIRKHLDANSLRRAGPTRPT